MYAFVLPPQLLLLLPLLLAALPQPSSAAVISSVVSNVFPRRSVDGSILDAHDSKMLFINGTFHWFADSFGDCRESPGPNGCANVTTGACGFEVSHRVSHFTSTDLVHWSDADVVFSALQIGVANAIMYAPKVIFNPSTREFVLWFNWFLIDGKWNRCFFGVAASANPAGPFALVSRNVSTLAYTDVGDLNLFVDEADGAGYIIYTSHINAGSYSPAHVMSVERLTPDYYATLGAAASSGPIGASNVEAPMFFKRGSSYHAVFGQCCCNNAAGTQSLIDYTATSPLGPWTAGGIVGTQAT